MRLSCLLVLLCAAATAAERPVNPTWLYRNLAETSFKKDDLTTAKCRYKPLFGKGDADTAIVKGVARYGEMTVEPGGESAVVRYSSEEQVYYVLAGEGEAIYRETRTPIRKGDFMYFAPGTDHGAANPSSEPLRIVVMGFFVPEDVRAGAPVKLPLANESEARKQVVGNHPPTTLYQLLMGDVTSQRDLLATGHGLTSLFIMEFAPGGTNHPHHHPKEEEIYLLLEGRGEMVAGGGMDGVEGRHPAKPGDAYFYRLNATVGFYNDPDPAAGKARILAIRSLYPGMTK